MSSTQAEIKLVQLKSCFVNVPQSVVTVLDNAKAVGGQCSHHYGLTYEGRLYKMSSLSSSIETFPQVVPFPKGPVVSHNALYMQDGRAWRAQQNLSLFLRELEEG